MLAKIVSGRGTMSRKYKRHNRGLYILSALLLGTVIAAAIAAALSDHAASIVFDPSYLQIILALLSLAVALITFGLIGDSEALVKSEDQKGLSVQVTGSAAAFVIFFILLTWGLSPYKNLSVYLYGEKGNLLRPSDGAVEITLVGRIRRSVETSDGSAIFAYLPKSEDHRLLISGQSWVVDTLKPPECITTDERISSRCDLIEAYLKKAPPCLEQIAFISREVTPVKTNLDTLLHRLLEAAQRASPQTGATLSFSERLLKSNTPKKLFVINRQFDTERSVCSHLADIKSSFDSSQRKTSIRTYISCDRILIISPGEPSPPKEFRECQ